MTVDTLYYIYIHEWFRDEVGGRRLVLLMLLLLMHRRRWNGGREDSGSRVDRVRGRNTLLWKRRRRRPLWEQNTFDPKEIFDFRASRPTDARIPRATAATKIHKWPVVSSRRRCIRTHRREGGTAGQKARARFDTCELSTRPYTSSSRPESAVSNIIYNILYIIYI